MNVSAKLNKIKVIVLDVDGVLTDGRFGYDNDMQNEIKFFHARDGHGIRVALRAGLKVGMLSGRASSVNRKRAEELGLSFCLEKCHDKKASFEKLCQDLGIGFEECLYIGDDVIDAPPMLLAGVSVAVQDADENVKAIADKITQNKGGHGAVREVIDWVLKEQGLFEEYIIRRYFQK